jgi:hypothetical protein
VSDPLDRLLRYHRGELSDAEAEELRQRLETDGEARRWDAWIGLLSSAGSGDSPETGAGEPDPIEIAALAEGRLAEPRASEVRAALAGMADGDELLETALAEVRANRKRWWVHRLLRDARTWAAAAVLVVIAVLGYRAREGRPDLASLVQRSPLAVPTVRSAEGALARGFSAYREGRYEDAADELRTATQTPSSECEAWLYLGSSLFLLSRDEEAGEALLHARGSCAGSLADEAAWQLAQVRLASGDGPAAAALLQALEGSHREDDAREILEVIGGG